MGIGKGSGPGVPKAIATPEIMWEHFDAYRTKTKGNPVMVHDFVGKDADEVERKKEKPLTYEGFCNYLEDEGIIIDPIHYFINYENRYEAFVRVCSRIRRVIREDQITGGLVGIYNPSVTQRLNNLVEKVESENKHEVKGINMLFQQSPGCEPLNKMPDAEPGS